MQSQSDRHILKILTLLGAGNLPYMPGTWGSLLALSFMFIPAEIQGFICLVFILYFWKISIPFIDEIEEDYGDDPSFIVIDEAIGIWIVLMTPMTYDNYYWAIIGFILFRFFDIVKPYPINLLNNKKGGMYVILDDVLAAVYTIICLYLIYLLY